MKKYIFYFTLFVCIFALNACQPTVGKSKQNTDDETALLAKTMAGQKDIPTKNNPRDKKRIPYIIGDLGGQPVNLPRGAIELLEYEDSPGWDKEKWKTYQPKERTYNSKITSFGFQFRLSDKAIKQYKVTDREYYQETKHPKKHDWMRVSIHSHIPVRENKSAYKYPANSFEVRNENDKFCKYSEKPERIYNLDLYISYFENGEKCKRINIGEKFYGGYDDLYIHKDDNKIIDTFIYCSNRGIQHCTQRFSLHKHNDMQVQVSVYYHRYLLPQWQEIQDKTTEIILGFIAENIDLGNKE